jgi:signal transduction histidine kinase
VAKSSSATRQAGNCGNLAAYGFTTADLEALQALMTPEELSAFLAAINKNLTAQSLVADITNASQRIGELVAAVKSFTHMDQSGDKKLTDIHAGLRAVLQLMRHKLAHNNIRIEEHYDPGLPEIDAMAGELNQLWTNLIDNAIDAMAENGGGVLRINTGMAGTCVRVSITDNGPGIPDVIKNAIFDPFFTTKSVGKGTGLGLDIVAHIVRRHQGRVKIESEPGRTAFIVDLPLQQNPNQLPL